MKPSLISMKSPLIALALGAGAVVVPAHALPNQMAWAASELSSAKPEMASRNLASAAQVSFNQVSVPNVTPKPTSSRVYTLKSPDGRVSLNWFLQDGGMPTYAVAYKNKPILLSSRLGLLPDLTAGFETVKVSRATHKGQWTQVYGERKVVPDNYNELNVDLKHGSGRRLRITFRAYNEGAAFRYMLPAQEQQEFKLSGEQSHFHFPPETFGFEEHGTEGEYQKVPVSAMAPWGERPLTLQYVTGLFASLAEAGNLDYPRMLLSPVTGTPDTLVSALGGTSSNTDGPQPNGASPATLRAGDSTPWRLLIVGEKPGDLLERNYLVLNLNPPLALKDVSWIKPGNMMRDVTLTTDNSKAIIDAAAKVGIQYVLLDARWYGSEDAKTGDATTARAPNLDIAEIIRYGQSKNVGLILYVDKRQAKKQRDILFPLYEKWGVKGIKLGFVDVGPQSETAWITETIQKAAEHHLMLNIHDGFRPTGLTRTYPNLLTVEGIRGNENFPTAQHNCTLPFTRYIVGSGDYTICYYTDRLKVSHGHQLAMAVVSYSPLQALYWYDRPSQFGDEPELEFFRHLPTVWDETKVLNGEIGKFATIARRSGTDWFVGAINANEPRTLKIPLNFLKPGQRYTAHIYADSTVAPTRTHVAVTTREVNSRAVLDISLAVAGGQSIWITPSNGA